MTEPPMLPKEVDDLTAGWFDANTTLADVGQNIKNLK